MAPQHRNSDGAGRERKSLDGEGRSREGGEECEGTLPVPVCNEFTAVSAQEEEAWQFFSFNERRQKDFIDLWFKRTNR